MVDLSHVFFTNLEFTVFDQRYPLWRVALLQNGHASTIISLQLQMVADFNQRIHAQLAEKRKLFQERHYLLLLTLLNLLEQGSKVFFLDR